jgi:hypothetical protein
MAIPASRSATGAVPAFTLKRFQVALLGQATEAGGNRVFHPYLLNQLLDALERGRDSDAAPHIMGGNDTALALGKYHGGA